MRGAEGRVIYVGKAVNLAGRVRSYFTPSAQENPKTRRLVAEVASLEFIVTDSELEALILEANLIKAHRPRFNVRLRDDKRYPYIKVTWAEAPTRASSSPAALSGTAAATSAPSPPPPPSGRPWAFSAGPFPYLTCSREITGRDSRACLYHDMKLCLAPCIGAVSQEEYRAMIAGLVRFLEGRSEEVLADLEKRMREAAERLDFEQAARLRDQLQAARHIVERQKIVAATGSDQDVIAFARDNGNACVQVFFIRDGKLLGREYFLLEGGEAESDPGGDGRVPQAVLRRGRLRAPGGPPAGGGGRGAGHRGVKLRSKRGAKVVLRVLRQGRGRELLRMAAENAVQMLATFRAGWEADAHRQEQALEEIRQALGLPARPARMECYDVSTTQGAEPTASMVVFEQGVTAGRSIGVSPCALEKPDDYAGMREVLTRRLERWRTATSGEMTGVRGVKTWALLARPAGGGWREGTSRGWRWRCWSPSACGTGWRWPRWRRKRRPSFCPDGRGRCGLPEGSRACGFSSRCGTRPTASP